MMYTITQYDERGEVKDKLAFGVGLLPGKKRESLYIVPMHNDYAIEMIPVAYFHHDEGAEAFKGLLEKVFGMGKFQLEQEPTDAPH